MVEINCRNVLKFMAKHPGYPSLDDEAEQRHVTKLLDGFFGRFFGPLWDGTKYRDFRHDKGRSLHIGTGNVLDLIKNGDSVRAIHHEGVR